MFFCEIHKGGLLCYDYECHNNSSSYFIVSYGQQAEIAVLISSQQVGLLLLNKVIESNPEPFKPHYGQLLQLLGTVLQDHNNPTALYYCILTLTAITAYTGTEEMVRLHCCCLIGRIINTCRRQCLKTDVILLATEPDALYHPKFDYGSETPHQSKSGKDT